MQNKVLILDFGSQYTQLIARRVRELNVYCEIHPFNKIPKDLDSFKALILSGSPYSVREADSPRVNLDILLSKFPTLAVFRWIGKPFFAPFRPNLLNLWRWHLRY